MIKKLRFDSGSNIIQVAKECAPGCPYRNIFIEGSLESYYLARKMIYDIIDENNRAKRIPQFTIETSIKAQPNFEMIVPDVYLPTILGEGYGTLARIQEKSGAEILVPTMSTPGTQIRVVTIVGSKEETSKAKHLLYEVLEPGYCGHAHSNGILVPNHPQIDR
jgi:hypothetical protein